MNGERLKAEEMIAKTYFLEDVDPVFRDGIPTVKQSFPRHQNRVLRVEWGQRSGIVAIEGIVNFLAERDNLEGEFQGAWGCLRFAASKYYQSHKGTEEAHFHCFLQVLHTSIEASRQDPDPIRRWRGHDLC